MTRKSTMTEGLRSEPAIACDVAIKRAKAAYDQKSTVWASKASELAALEAARTDETDCPENPPHNPTEQQQQLLLAREDLERAKGEQNAAFLQYREALTKKYATVAEILTCSGLKIKALEADPATAESDLNVARMDLTILSAATADIEAQIKDLEKKQQGKRKRNPAPQAKNRKGTLAAKGLTKEIAAVLAEADKVKTTTKTVDTTARYRLKAKYAALVPEMMKKFNYKNINEVPRLEKVLLNMGLGDVKDDGKEFAKAVEELKTISGQKPVATKAKKSIANFKVREGQNIGAKVTLRGNRMYEFLDKFICVVLPRVRDFKGVNPNSFDGRGNYAMGVKEQLIFPEIKYDQVSKVRGLDVVVVTSAKTDEEAKELLRLLGMPFKA